MNQYRWALAGIMALVCLGSAPRSPAADEKPPADATAFPMKEISIFDQKPGELGVSIPLLGGVTAQLTATPAKEVKAYPKLNSKRPLYGTVVSRDAEKPGKTSRFYLVLDQSPEAIQAAGKAEAEAAAKPDEPETEGVPDEEDAPAAGARKIVIKKNPAAEYDLLYFDANHDLDLTNDGALRPMKERPKVPWLGNAEQIRVFDPVAVSLGEGRSVRVVPMAWTYGNTGMMNFAAASAWQGEIRLGKKAYKATLAQAGGTFGRFDLPSSPLVLTPLDGPKRPSSYAGMSTLGTMRETDGEFYALSASPTGDRLFVRLFPGERGVLEVSPGRRDIKEMGLTGILRWKDNMLLLGDISPVALERARVAKYRVPVGEYQPLVLNVDYGRLQVSLRMNYNRRPGDDKTPAGIKIAADKPYVLDFSEKAEMQFLSPAEDKVFKPGETIRLAAMLAIPDKNLLVGDLTDTSKKIGEIKYMVDGKQQTAPRYASLEPAVVVTDSAGKKVGGGKMPFG